MSGLKAIVLWHSKKWKEWLLFLLVGFGLSYLVALRHISMYPATVSFILSDENQQVSSMGGLFTQLGLPVSAGRYNIDKLMEVARSRTIVQAALLDSATVDGREDLIANHLIANHDLGRQLEKEDVAFENFSFSHNDASHFDNTENRVLKILYGMMAGRDSGDSDKLFEADYGRDHYVMTFTVKTLNEDLSIALAKALFTEVSSFYLNTSRKNKRNTYQLLAAKRDSVSQRLTEVEFELARLRDSNLGGFATEGNLKESRLQTESVILRSALSEAEKNLGLAQFALETGTPLIQIIDEPIPPLQPTTYSSSKFAIFGLLIAIVLFAGCEFIRFLIK